MAVFRAGSGGRLARALLLCLAAGAGLLSAWPWVRTACFLLLAIGAIDAAAALAFGLLLPAIRLRVPALLEDLILAAAYVLAGFGALTYAGVNLTGIVATSAVVSTVIAFSLQDTLGNILGGMVLHLESSLATGDWVRLPTGEEGRVAEIRWRQTAIETNAGNTIVVPNSSLIKGNVTVVGRRGGRSQPTLRRIPFNVYYDKSPNEVIQAVEKALRLDPPRYVAAQPPPDCFLSELKDNCASYMAGYWLQDFTAGARIDSEMRTRIYHGLARAGIKLSNPVRSITVNQQDSEVAERNRIQEQERRIAALQEVGLFSSLNEAELAVLAESLKAAPFARGEVLTRQGAKANWLYLLVKGEAEVRLESADGKTAQSVAKLSAGDFMGEMGLLTGEPRAATVIARTDVFCYRLDRDSFTDIVANRPAIAEGISSALARRKVELESAREGLNDETRRQRIEKTQGALLSRIRDFFRLS